MRIILTVCIFMILSGFCITKLEYVLGFAGESEKMVTKRRNKDALYNDC